MLHVLVSILCLFTCIVACNSNDTKSNGNNGLGCKKIGVLLPGNDSSLWGTQVKPLLSQTIMEQLPGASVDFNNPQGSDAVQQAQQQTQAAADLTNGDCILVVAAVNSITAAAIVNNAKLHNVPVIAYDRLIQSRNLAYYVSFDGVKVGELQGQYIIDHFNDYVKGNNRNVVLINGPPTDNNTFLFRQGVLHKLQPFFDNGALTKILDVFTPQWQGTLAQKEMRDALTKYHNNIQIASIANDNMANAVITTLKTVKLNGKVLVTGQNATVIAIQNILLGNQAMTVYKPLKLEAMATAKLVAALSNGADTSSLTHDATIQTVDGASIPAVIETPISVDRSNITSTVIADGFVSISAVCSGLPAGTNTNGLCP